MPAPLLSIIPASLAKELEERYENLGTKYLTEITHDDGRLVNQMMYTSRIQNCREEVVDAVFCILGWILKATLPENPESRFVFQPNSPPDSAYEALKALIMVYSLLCAEYELDSNI